MPAILELEGTRTIPWNESFPAGITADRVYFGRDETGVGEVQLAVAAVTSRPTKGVLEAMWKTRSANTAMPVVVAAVGSELCGAIGDSLDLGWSDKPDCAAGTWGSPPRAFGPWWPIDRPLFTGASVGVRFDRCIGQCRA